MAGELTVRLLGPVEVWRGGVAVPAGGPTQRAVLAMLALHAGESVHVDGLADGIWGEGDEPAGVAKAMQVHVTRLRRVLKRGQVQPLQTVPGGYRLALEGVAIDCDAFERALDAGRAQLATGDPATAASELASALALWRGPALMDLRDFPFAVHVALRFDELRVDAAEAAIAARLALGESQSLIPELQALIAANPYRERLHAQLMTALYRAGQQAAALDAYTAARSRLVLDLGVEPGPELEALQQQILTHDPELSVPQGVVASEPVATTTGSAFATARLPSVPVLFGRDALLAELEELAEDERLLTLTGAGGSGKTVFALALARGLAAQYPDGAAFVDLAAVTRPDHVLPAVAAALGVTPRGGSLPEQLAEVLADQRRLVVLDNCEHLMDAVPELAPLVDATAGLFIATSRTPLGLRAEHLVPIPPLPLPAADEHKLVEQPAVALFTRAAVNAGGVLGPDDLPAVADLCRAVDGLPLAIEIVAAQTRVESLAELSATLHARLPSLAARARDVPDRQRTVEAAIGWSLDQVKPTRRRAFGRLAVFAGGFDARGAAAVLERDRPATIALLSDLLDASLLVRQPSAGGQARFRMLEPLRDVAIAGADTAERRRATRRHADFMVAEVERLCPAAIGIRTPEDHSQLRLAHEDLIVALEHLGESAPDDMIDLVWQLEDYWGLAGQDSVALAILEAAVRRRRLSDRAGCLALILIARYRHLVGDPDGSREAVDRALVLVEHIADPVTLSRARAEEASLSWLAGDRDGARVAGRAALAEARRADDERQIARAILGELWRSPEDRPHANRGRLIDEVRRIAESRGALLLEGDLYECLIGYRAAVEHDPDGALDAARSAYEIGSRFGSPAMEAVNANNIATCLVRGGGSLAVARSMLAFSVRTHERMGHKRWALETIASMGEAEAARREWRSALVLISSAGAILRRMGIAVPDATHDAVSADAEAHLGPEDAAAARAIGEQMTYREALGFALKVGGVTDAVSDGPSRSVVFTGEPLAASP